MHRVDLGHLPPHLQAAAFSIGEELAWPRKEALEVIDWIAHRGWAVEGVEIWLPAESGPEIPFPLMYTWQVPPRTEKESWPTFVMRAKEQASSYIRNFRGDASDLAYQNREPFFNLDITARSY
jgi:hypothetical protein